MVCGVLLLYFVCFVCLLNQFLSIASLTAPHSKREDLAKLVYHGITWRYFSIFCTVLFTMVAETSGFTAQPR